jgi:glycosyltransferase involved in cell wall biosynthesis
LVADRERLRLVYHGLDLANLPPPPRQRSRRDGSDPADPVVILSVGRRVAKKGYDDLLTALARLPGDLHWRFEHIGAGVLGDTFEQTAEKLGIADRCVWHGARPQAEVFAAYQRADIFVLASKTADDGDREGMPNVLQEAGYQRMAIVSTRSAAIGEFIADNDNGLLADPASPDQLAVALERLCRDPELRARVGARANEIVRTRFSYEAGVDWIARALAQPRAARLAPQIEIPEARAAE